MIFSLKKLILSLIDIIIGSPTSILFIILGIIFSVAMIINIKKNKTIGKTLYMIGWIFIITFIIVKYNNYISKIFDNLINTIFMQIFFPNLATYAIIIIITNIIFLYTVFNKKTNISDKLINSPFFIIIMVLMVYTIELVSKNNINVYQRKEVYSNDTLITIIESTTLIFTLWMIIILSKFILKKLIKKSDNKIIKEYELKNKESNNITNQEPPIIQTQNINQEQPIPQITPNPIINEDIIQTNTFNQEPVIPQITPNTIIEKQVQTNTFNQEPVIPQINPNTIINEEPIQANIFNQEQPMPQINPNTIINEEPIQANIFNQEQPIPQITPNTIINEEPIQANIFNQEQPIPQITPNPIINEDIIQTNTFNQEQPMPQINPNTIINEEPIQANIFNQEQPIPQITPNTIINEEPIQANIFNQEQPIPQITPNPIINEEPIQTNTFNQESATPQAIENQIPITQKPTINTESEIIKTYENTNTNQTVNEQTNTKEQSIDKEIQNNPDIFDALPPVTQANGNEKIIESSMTLPKEEEIEVLKI